MSGASQAGLRAPAAWVGVAAAMATRATVVLMATATAVGDEAAAADVGALLTLRVGLTGRLVSDGFTRVHWTCQRQMRTRRLVRWRRVWLALTADDAMTKPRPFLHHMRLVSPDQP